jgi:DNA-binding Xre family transcriptional regulator
MPKGTVVFAVRDILAERGLTVGNVAEQSGAAYNTILNVERDASTRIDKDTIAAICEATGTQPGDWIKFIPGD